MKDNDFFISITYDNPRKLSAAEKKKLEQFKAGSLQLLAKLILTRNSGIGGGDDGAA